MFVVTKGKTEFIDVTCARVCKGCEQIPELGDSHIHALRAFPGTQTTDILSLSCSLLSAPETLCLGSAGWGVLSVTSPVLWAGGPLPSPGVLEEGVWSPRLTAVTPGQCLPCQAPAQPERGCWAQPVPAGPPQTPPNLPRPRTQALAGRSQWPRRG